ncbi:hypothetical protein RIF29_38064 [Crotalaria pallida]|uniref:Uncharacterized protein n=1 Tax=Crotalaria pallida TaxID=3830 RepID=A0AAN9HNK0_CROPI
MYKHPTSGIWYWKEELPQDVGNQPTTQEEERKEKEAAFHAADKGAQNDDFMDAQIDPPPPHHPDFDYQVMHDSFISYVDTSIDRVSTRLDSMERNILDSQTAIEQRMMDAFNCFFPSSSDYPPLALAIRAIWQAWAGRALARKFCGRAWAAHFLFRAENACPARPHFLQAGMRAAHFSSRIMVEGQAIKNPV